MAVSNVLLFYIFVIIISSNYFYYVFEHFNINDSGCIFNNNVVVITCYMCFYGHCNNNMSSKSSCGVWSSQRSLEVISVGCLIWSICLIISNCDKITITWLILFMWSSLHIRSGLFIELHLIAILVLERLWNMTEIQELPSSHCYSACYKIWWVGFT